LAAKYQIKFTKRAFRDLDAIYSYIANNLSEPAIAQKLIDTIENEILSLETMPSRCPERRIGTYAGKGYRQLLVKNYTAIYRVDEERKTVIIITIRYSSSQF